MSATVGSIPSHESRHTSDALKYINYKYYHVFAIQTITPRIHYQTHRHNKTTGHRLRWPLFLDLSHSRSTRSIRSVRVGNETKVAMIPNEWSVIYWMRSLCFDMIGKWRSFESKSFSYLLGNSCFRVCIYANKRFDRDFNTKDQNQRLALKATQTVSSTERLKGLKSKNLKIGRITLIFSDRFSHSTFV